MTDPTGYSRGYFFPDSIITRFIFFIFNQKNFQNKNS